MVRRLPKGIAAPRGAFGASFLGLQKASTQRASDAARPTAGWAEAESPEEVPRRGAYLWPIANRLARNGIRFAIPL